MKTISLMESAEVCRSRTLWTLCIGLEICVIGNSVFIKPEHSNILFDTTQYGPTLLPWQQRRRQMGRESEECEEEKKNKTNESNDY